MAAKGMSFPWRLNQSTITANLELIWGMSDHMLRGRTRMDKLLSVKAAPAMTAAGILEREVDV